MRILHAIGTLSPFAGGPSVVVVPMARAVAALGHDVSVHAADHRYRGLPAGDVAVGKGRLRVAVHRHHPPAALTRHASLDLWRSLAREIPAADVVHLHSLYMFHDWVVWRECRRAGVPYILQPHGALDPFLFRHHRWRKAAAEWLFQNCVTRDATLINFTSEVERELAQPYVFGRPGTVVPVGVDLERSAVLPPPGKLRERYPEIGNRKIVLFLGRLNFKKGLEILVPAFADACKRRSDLHLVIAGPDGGFEKRTRALVLQHGIADHTTFTGYLELQACLEAYAAADAFVLPSRTENFAISAAEAMAAGVPCLLSKEVQIAPAAAQAGACRLIPLDIAAWSEGILDLLSSPDAARAMGKQAAEYVRKTYSWNVIAEQLVAMYCEAMARSRSPRARSEEEVRRSLFAGTE